MTRNSLIDIAAIVYPILLLLVLGIPLSATAAPLVYVRVSPQAPPLEGHVQNTILGQRYLQGMSLHLGDTEATDTTVPLADGFLCATDPVFSFDGTRVLFSGKRTPQEPLQLWETRLDAPAPRLLFSSDRDCIQPLYLPNGNVLFTSVSGEFEEHGRTLSLSLFTWSPESAEPARITFNPSSDFDPAILFDGRIVFSSWQHLGNHFWPTGNIALNVVNWDGTGLFPLTGNHREPWIKHGAVPVDYGRVAYVQGNLNLPFAAGKLVAAHLSDAFGLHPSLSDSLHVSHAAALPGGGLLASARRSADETFDLFTQSDEGFVLLVRNESQHILRPAVYRSAYTPDTRFSTVVPETPHGYLLILNARETDLLEDGQVPLADAQTLRVIEGMPLNRGTASFFSHDGNEQEPWANGFSSTGYIPSRILGEVPLAKDGSVYLKVPADRPLRIQLVDDAGFASMNEKAWFWVRPNERRVCLGCHENRETAPHNRTPLAAKREPTDLTDPGQWTTVSFKNDIQPIVAKTCAVEGCHVPPRPSAAFNLSADLLEGNRDAAGADRFGPAYANLLARQPGKPLSVGGRRIHPGDSRQSPLLWMLYGRILGKQFAKAPFERPIDSGGHPGPMLPENQLSLIRRWVDLGAVYDYPGTEVRKNVASWSKEKADEH